MISSCTKAALAAVRARGMKLGGNRGGPKVDCAKGRAARSHAANEYARQIGPIALAAWEEGGGPKGGYGHAVAVLKERGIRTPLGGQWTRAAVRSLMQRHAALAPA